MKRTIMLLLVVAILPLIYSCDAVGKVVGLDLDKDSYMTGTVTLQGRTDHSGATVWMKENSSIRATTDSSGYYRIDNIPAGTYNPKATATGYQEKDWGGQPLNFPNEHKNINFTLCPTSICGT